MGPSAARTIAFSLAGTIDHGDLAALYTRVCLLLESSGASVALCDVSRAREDAVTVDALARVRLAARRHGCELRTRPISTELLELLAFTGLNEVLTR